MSDIAIVDTHIGINGIEAMKEIRKTNKSVIFIVLILDKFNHAKEAINLGFGVFDKPVNQSVLIQV